MSQQPYRDDEYVLRCQHHRKLHLACEQCQDELLLEERRAKHRKAGIAALCVIAGLVMASIWIFH